MTDDELMELALTEARAAPAHGDVPVGAVVWLDGEVIARRHNERERTGDPTPTPRSSPCATLRPAWAAGASTARRWP